MNATAARCDFCAGDAPVLSYRTSRPINTTAALLTPDGVALDHFARGWARPVTTHRSFGEVDIVDGDLAWAACRTCADIIERGATGRLITHVKAVFAAEGHSATRRELAAVFEPFMRYRLPEPIPLPPPTSAAPPEPTPTQQPDPTDSKEYP